METHATSSRGLDGRLSPSPRAVDGGARRSGGAPGAVVLAVEGVTKSFAGVTALREVDFDLRGGEVHALMGENGAGKSTLMKILAGVHIDYLGAVRIDGAPIAFAGVRDAEAAGIAIIHQELN